MAGTGAYRPRIRVAAGRAVTRLRPRPDAVASSAGPRRQCRVEPLNGVLAGRTAAPSRDVSRDRLAPPVAYFLGNGGHNARRDIAARHRTRTDWDTLAVVAIGVEWELRDLSR